MKYIFLGTPTFATIILEKLINSGFPPVLLVCNPDKPVGRNKIITPPPIKSIAENNDIKVWQPQKLDLNSWNSKLKEIGDVDVAIIAAYSKIISKDILDTLNGKFIGVHPSLLPKHRGASPIQQTILDGDAETGVTLFFVDEKVDHGKIISNTKYQTSSNDTYKLLEDKLARISGELLLSLLQNPNTDKLGAEEQNHIKATLTKKFKTEDGLVDLKKDNSEIIARKIRALNPEPGVYTIQNNSPPAFAGMAQSGKRLKLLEVKKSVDGWVITKTQLEGKKPKADRINLTK